MPWAKFVADFDFSPAARGGNVTIAYKAGALENVTTECFNAGLSAGALKAADKGGSVAAGDLLSVAEPTADPLAADPLAEADQ